MAPPSPRELFGAERLVAFSDGVFAVAITLLVLDLRLPAIGGEEGDLALLHALPAMRPKLLIFIFTFIIIGMSWMGHQRKFSYIRRIDTGLLWLNLLYLMALCLVPFVTGVLNEVGGRLGFVSYAALMALVSLLSAGLSAYGLRPPFLAEPSLPARARRDMILSPLLTGAIFLGSAAIAFSKREEIAHWSLLMIVPVSAFFGSRSRGAPAWRRAG